MSAQNWLIAAYQPDGSTLRSAYSWSADTKFLVSVSASSIAPLTTSITPTYAYVEQIDWQIERGGNCLQASFIGDSHGLVLDIQPRDVVVIATLGHLSGENTAYYYPRFRGVAKTPANPLRSDGVPHAYAFDGLFKACYYVRTPQNVNYAAGVDIGALLTKWAQDQYGAATFGTAYGDGASYSAIEYAAGSLPHGMFVAGASLGAVTQAAVNPGAASLGQYLDKLAQLATGAGTEAAWGVDRYGGVFLKAKGSTSLSLTEGDSSKDVVVAYPDVQADEVIERVQWVIADGDGSFGDTISLDTPDTQTYSTALNDGTWEDMTAPMQPPSGVNVFKDTGATLSINTSFGDPIFGVASYVGSSQDNFRLASDTPAGDYSTSGIALYAGDSVTNDIPNGAIVTFNSGASLGGTTSGQYLQLTTAAASGDTTLYGIVYNGTVKGYDATFNYRSTVQTRFLENDPIAYTVMMTDSNLQFHVALEMPAGSTYEDLARIAIDLELDSGSNNVLSGTEGQFRYYLQINSSKFALQEAGGQPQSIQAQPTLGDRARGMPSPSSLSLVTVNLVTDFVNGTIAAGQGALMYDLRDYRILQLDTDLLDKLAKQEFKAPKLNVVAVTVKGEQALADTLGLTFASGRVMLQTDIDRFEYSIYGEPQPGAVPRGGVRTTIHTGERAVPREMYLVRAIKKQSRDAVLKAKGAA